MGAQQGSDMLKQCFSNNYGVFVHTGKGIHYRVRSEEHTKTGLFVNLGLSLTEALGRLQFVFLIYVSLEDCTPYYRSSTGQA